PDRCGRETDSALHERHPPRPSRWAWRGYRRRTSRPPGAPMSTDPTSGPGEEPMQWEELLRAVLGPGADHAIAEMRAQGFDPQAMAAAAGLPNDPRALEQVLSRVQRMLASTGDEPVNWEIAHDVAR